MTAYELLSEPIRRYVKDQNWEDLTPIQTAAIVKIMTTDGNYILASKTASGKTEAAFLPILSKVNFEQFGVQVLYISPLIALINDQMERVEKLCKHLDVSVVKWHGEANIAPKKKLIESPNGIVLITPESLEALFQNKPNDIKRLFSSLKFVVIDEIHSYLSSDRGIHLKSLLHRLSIINDNSFRYIGLSATIGDYKQAKLFLGFQNEATVLLDKTPKAHNIRINYFRSEDGKTNELSLKLLKDLYKVTQERKTLIYANSRDCVEEVSVKLLKLSEKVGGHHNYFSHHSSVARRLREYAEYFAKHAKSEPFTICCTSTLELGIDIGKMDLIVQIKAPCSVSSMVQRMGRCGRSQNSNSELLMYPTNEFELLQSLACWKLHENGKLEVTEEIDKPYDILLHQMMSLVKERFEIAPSKLIQEMKSNPAFSNCETTSIKLIIKELIKNNMLEYLDSNLILGIAAESSFSKGDFYSVFWDKFEYEVRYFGDIIGKISPFNDLFVGQQIFLAGGIWIITEIDKDNLTISVNVSSAGQIPRFDGESISVSYEVEKEMLHLLYDSESYSVLNETGREVLRHMRNEFADYKRIGSSKIPAHIDDKNNEVTIFPFCGSKILKSIHLLFALYNQPIDLIPQNRSLIFRGNFEAFQKAISTIISNENEKQIIKYLEGQDWNNISKYSKFLPKNLQVNMVYHKLYDFPSAIKELQRML